MNKYERVRLDLENSIRKIKPSQNFSEIIDDYASKGYRFKQLFTPTGKNGTPKYYDIIFEKTSDGSLYIYDYLQVEVDHKAKNDLLVDDYWEDIINYQLKGWDFVTIVAPANLKGGIPKYFELIFEKKTFTPPVQDYIPQYQDYDYQRQYLSNREVTGPGQPLRVEHEKPSQQKDFNLPTGETVIPKPIINPYIAQQPVVDIPVIDDSLLHEESDVKDIIHELPEMDIKTNNHIDGSDEEKPLYQKEKYQEEKIDRYEKDSDEKEDKPKFIFKDEITNEVIDKDYAKRFFNQIGKNEEKVPMKAKPTNVGFVEFEDDEDDI